MKEIRLFAGTSERNKVELFARLSPEAIIVLLQGGEKPHIGAVVLTIPHSCSADGKMFSCNSWTVPVLTHKDDEIAKPCAEKIAGITGKATVVIAGIHVQDARPEEISLFINNCNLLVQKLLSEYF